MIDQDKFGKKIYPKVFDILKFWGVRLRRCGYKESKNKPNLFYKKIENKVIFFADMRGTEEVPIWEDPVPLFYWQFLEDLPEDLKCKMIWAEYDIFKKFKIKYRLSIEMEHSFWDELFDESCSKYEKSPRVEIIIKDPKTRKTIITVAEELAEKAINFLKMTWGKDFEIIVKKVK